MKNQSKSQRESYITLKLKTATKKIYNTKILLQSRYLQRENRLIVLELLTSENRCIRKDLLQMLKIIKGLNYFSLDKDLVLRKKCK